MTLEEAIKEYQYDVCLFYTEDEDEKGEIVFGWKWDINGGYSSVGSANIFDNPNDALDELKVFLEKQFTPFTK